MVFSLSEQTANQNQQLDQAKSVNDALTQGNHSKEVEIKELKLKLSHQSSATEEPNAKLVEVTQSRESLMKLFKDSKSINHRQKVQLEQKEKNLCRANDDIIRLRRLLQQRDAEISKISLRCSFDAATYEQKLEEARIGFETATANNLSRLDGKVRQIEQLKQKLEEAETGFETATANNLSRLDGKERQIEQLKSSLKIQMDVLVEIDGERNQLKIDEKAMKQKIEYLERELKKHVTKCSELEASLATLATSSKRDLKAKDQSIAALQGDLEAKDQSVAALQGILEAKNQSIAALQGDLEAQDQSILALQGDLEAKDQSIAALKGELEKRHV